MSKTNRGLLEAYRRKRAFDRTSEPFGGGTVMVWDAGTYRNLKRIEENGPSLAEQLKAGHVTIWLEGRKLTGGFALNRIAEQPAERWLLVKMKDEGADARRKPVRTETESVLSGRSLAAIEEAEKNDRQAQAGGDDTDG
jgi:hypothetical protein